jgi:hypothetical protein
MAGYFVRMDENLPGRPEVLQVAEVTGRSPEEVVGFLLRLWRWVQREAKAPGIIPGVGLAALLHECRGDERLWLALADTGWIAFATEGIHIANWNERFSDVAIRRADDAQRKRISRAKAREQADSRGDESGDATAVTPDRMEADRGSVFEHLLGEHLGQTGAMIEWIEWQALQRGAVCPSDDEHYRLVLAAARFSLNSGKEPIAYFKWIVGKRMWRAIPDLYLRDAAKRIALDVTLRERARAARQKAMERLGGDRRPLTKAEQVEYLHLRMNASRTA